MTVPAADILQPIPKEGVNFWNRSMGDLIEYLRHAIRLGGEITVEKIIWLLTVLRLCNAIIVGNMRVPGRPLGGLGMMKPFVGVCRRLTQKRPRKSVTIGYIRHSQLDGSNPGTNVIGRATHSRPGQHRRKWSRLEAH